jgi:hypothetical protein
MGKVKFLLESQIPCNENQQVGKRPITQTPFGQTKSLQSYLVVRLVCIALVEGFSYAKYLTVFIV